MHETIAAGDSAVITERVDRRYQGTATCPSLVPPSGSWRSAADELRSRGKRRRHSAFAALGDPSRTSASEREWQREKGQLFVREVAHANQILRLDRPTGNVALRCNRSSVVGG